MPEQCRDAETNFDAASQCPYRELLTQMADGISSLKDDMRSIKTILIGNGMPGNSIVVRMDRLEHKVEPLDPLTYARVIESFTPEFVKTTERSNRVVTVCLYFMGIVLSTAALAFLGHLFFQVYARK